MRKLLLPFSFLYWIAISLRNWFFDRGLLKTKRVGIPVISVGNISTGGVGKTPTVEMLIEKFVHRTAVGVVSRGYGRKSSGCIIVSNGRGMIAPPKISGDEPSQIAIKYPTVIVIADEIRFRGIQKAMELGAQLIVLDDGFQHRYVHRDVNIVVLTADEILNGAFLLPAGNRRETLQSVSRADVVMISRCRNVEEFERAKHRLGREHVLGVRTTLISFNNGVGNKRISRDNVSAKQAVLFSGIGNPHSFESLLESVGVHVVKHFNFPDHHWYSDYEIQRIVDTGTTFHADYIITTEKDAARLREQYQDFLRNEKVLVAEIRQEIFSGAGEFEKVLDQVNP